MSFTIYEHANYKGKSKKITRGSVSYVGKTWNDKVSSLKVSSGTRVSYYEHKDFGGDYSYRTSDDNWIGDKWNDKISSCIVFDKNQVKRWMKSVSDNTRLSDLSIPGTHDSVAKLSLPYAQCQTKSIYEQLKMGVRFLDIRCKKIAGALICFHGDVPLGDTLNNVLEDCGKFLRNYPSETIIFSLKDEKGSGDFDECFRDKYYTHKDYKHLFHEYADEIPRLGECRGQLVLLRRFPTKKGWVDMGIDAYPWGDNKTFTEGKIKVQDKYKEGDPDQKWKSAKSLFETVKDDKGANKYLYLNFLSGYSTDIGIDTFFSGPDTPKKVAKGVNQKARKYISGYKKTDLGVVIMDFVEPGIAALIVNSNSEVNLFNY